MYLIIIALGLCLSYFVLFKIFTVFFAAKTPRISLAAVRSVFIILGFSILGYTVTFLIPDLEIGNRVLHGFVGGFLGVLICYLVVKDGGFVISRLQFFIFSLLLVTALGVANEHMEYFLETYVRFLFYSNPKDTWLDLLSNTVGILIGNAFLIPFIGKTKTG